MYEENNWLNNESELVLADLPEVVASNTASNAAGISLNATQLTITEGQVYNLVVTMPTGATIQSWSVTHGDSVTVSSTGKVTGVCTGDSIIIVTVIYNRTGYTLTCNVTVRIPNGIYYLQNKNNSKYLTSSQGVTDSQISVNTQNKKTPTSDGADYQYTKLRQMWMVTYIGSGRYSIRPYNLIKKGLKDNSGVIKVNDVHVSESTSYINTLNQWTIMRKNGANSNFIIKNQSTGKYMTVSSAGVANTGTYSSTNTSYEWGLSKITNPVCGVLIYDGSGNVMNGKSTLFTDPNATQNIYYSSYQDMAAGATARLYVEGVYPSEALNGTPNDLGYFATSTFFLNVSSHLLSLRSPGTSKVVVKQNIKGTDYQTSYTVKYRKNPETNGQNKMNLCWTVASKMVAEHNTGNNYLPSGGSELIWFDNLYTDYIGKNEYTHLTADAGQRYIVLNEYGDDRDRPSRNGSAEKAMRLTAGNNNLTISGIYNNGDVLSSSQINQLNSLLLSGKYVYGGLVDRDDNLDVGHAIVIMNYDVSDRKYVYWDPFLNGIDTFCESDLLNSNIQVTANGHSDVYYRLDFIIYC